MSARRLLSPMMLVLCLLGLWLAPLPAELAEPAPLGEPAANSSEPEGTGVAGIAPAGGQIDVAVTEDFERDPAVALCASDQYLSVYVVDGDVYGQRLTNEGALLGEAFLIYDGTHYAGRPDVACQWSLNRFVVVWHIDYLNQGADYDIYAQAVYGGHQSSGSQLIGEFLRVSETYDVEQSPAIACSSTSYGCLVAFTYSGTGSGDIYMQRVAVGASSISLDGDRYNISQNSGAEDSPDVAWGGGNDLYLVVWQNLYDSPVEHNRIIFTHVYGAEQGAGADEREHDNTRLIALDEMQHHQESPAVAYNRYQGRYLVAFQYDFNGDGSDYDVYARRVSGSGGTVRGDPFSVGSTFNDERSPAVAFSGGTENFSDGFGGNQYLVTYITDEGSNGTILYGQAVKGAYASSGSQREGSARAIGFAPPFFGWTLTDADIVGSVNNGWYAVVWQYGSGGINPDYDALGQIVVPSAQYLPAVDKSYYDSPATWDSSFNISNLGDVHALVNVYFYQQGGNAIVPDCLRYIQGSCDLENPFILDAGAKEEIYMQATGAQLANTRYAVVVRSDQPIATIGSFLATDGQDYLAGSYTALEDLGQTKMYLPGVQSHFYGWDSTISVQNLGGSSQDISVTFYRENTNTTCYTAGPQSVPAYAAWHLDTSSLSLTPCDANGDGFNGAAVVEGSAPLAAVDNQVSSSGSSLTGLISYNGFASGAPTLYIPDLYRNTFPPGNWESSINIMNVGDSDSTVSVYYSPTEPLVYSQRTLAPYEGWLLYLPVDVPGLPESTWSTYSAKINSTGGNVVAIVNSASSSGQAMTYNATSSGGQAVAVPVVSRNYYGWDTSFAVQNLGGNSVTVDVEYSPNANPLGPTWSGASYTLPAIEGQESLLVYQGNGDNYLCEATGGSWDNNQGCLGGGESLPENYTGSAILTIGSGSGPIAVVINQTNGPGQAGNPGDGDWSASFNGVNK